MQPDHAAMPWQSQADPAVQGVSGSLLWSTSRQEGCMTFRGLASNDPSPQHQLWMFDADLPDERSLIDGGLFNVAMQQASSRPAPAPRVDRADRPAHPRGRAAGLRRDDRTPRGVVVTTRERLLLLA